MSAKPHHLSALEKLCTKIEGMMEGRDELIRSAAKAGHSNVEIAQATGLTRQRVWQIVNESDAPRRPYPLGDFVLKS